MYEGVEMSLAEIYMKGGGGGSLAFRSVKRPKRANRQLL